MLFSLVVTVLITSIAIKVLMHVAGDFGMLDIPDNRKQHSGHIPLIGGVAIFVGILTALLFFHRLTPNILTYLLCAGAVVSLGIVDDVYGISAKKRLFFQAIITGVMCLGSGLYLHSFGNLFGAGDIGLPVFGYLVTVLAVIGAINAFNMLDGIDGLLGINALISFMVLALLFYQSEQSSGLMLSLVFVAALIPYLAANLTISPFKKKIFIGDAGSMLIGLTIVWMLLYGSQQTEVQSFRPVTALWLIALPLMDMVAIMVRRVIKGQSPLIADRDHLHHIFMRAGFSDRQTLLIISLASIVLAGFGLLGEWLLIPEVIMFLLFLLLFSGYSYALVHSWRLIKLVRRFVHPLDNNSQV